MKIYKDKDVFRAGYRAGEFFNPIYATIITSETRLLISKSCKAIEEKGGKPFLIMRDSIFWTGRGSMTTEWNDFKCWCELTEKIN